MIPRRAERVELGLLVQLVPGGAGTLVNLSATGALVEVAAPAQLGDRLSVTLPWQNQVLQLFGRVVRCSPQYTSNGHLEWQDPDSYRVAIEFIDQDSNAALSLTRFMRHTAGLRDPGSPTGKRAT